MNVIGERSSRTHTQDEVCECVCVCGDIITETTLSVFSGKEKDLLTGRTEEKVSSKKLNLLCHKHGYLISAFLLLFDLNF